MKGIYRGLAALVLAATIASCEPGSQGEVISLDTETATPSGEDYTEGPGFPISRDNNPFRINYNFNEKISFEYLFEEEPVEGLRGTIIDSYLGYSVGDYGDEGTVRPFSWIILRGTDNNLYYMIYPTERIFPEGQRVRIARYWEIKEDAVLLNNMLTYITDIPGEFTYDDRMNFQIESSAPDGHVDGIIELGAVEYIGPEGE
ncbi:TPA: hypothetical protein HA239_00625 [Candidatus Woesearchaeota archaeon]|nr:hypothetical protein QT06_C0001G0166 [archaeon GW2011_AR15]MBS3104031.1 hypothetical protein [Candidatus Woesearchaeota archaeon]HIH40901.1 hypothetical protein [Candidatus Woesearchaeota archaeon]